jgi:hypothetical protein
MIKQYMLDFKIFEQFLFCIMFDGHKIILFSHFRDNKWFGDPLERKLKLLRILILENICFLLIMGFCYLITGIVNTCLEVICYEPKSGKFSLNKVIFFKQENNIFNEIRLHHPYLFWI